MVAPVLITIIKRTSLYQRALRNMWRYVHSEILFMNQWCHRKFSTKSDVNNFIFNEGNLLELYWWCFIRRCFGDYCHKIWLNDLIDKNPIEQHLFRLQNSMKEEFLKQEIKYPLDSYLVEYSKVTGVLCAFLLRSKCV